jgi:hypothetical protein
LGCILRRRAASREPTGTSLAECGESMRVETSGVAERGWVDIVSSLGSRILDERCRPQFDIFEPSRSHAIESLREALCVALWMRRIGTDHYRPRLVQVCTGPEDASQHDSFLPQCPITFRKVVIPAGYKGRHQGDTSHRVLDEKTASRIRNVLTPQDLSRSRIVRQRHLKILEVPIGWPCPRAIQICRSWSPRR